MHYLLVLALKGDGKRSV